MDPLASIGSMDRHGKMLTESQVKEKREKQGKCPKCERQLYNVFVMRKVPLNIPGEVQNGHCLRCEEIAGDLGGADCSLSASLRMSSVFAKMHRRGRGRQSGDMSERSGSSSFNNSFDASGSIFSSLSSPSGSIADCSDGIIARLSFDTGESDADLGRFVKDTDPPSQEKVWSAPSGGERSLVSSTQTDHFPTIDESGFAGNEDAKSTSSSVSSARRGRTLTTQLSAASAGSVESTKPPLVRQNATLGRQGTTPVIDDESDKDDDDYEQFFSAAQRDRVQHKESGESTLDNSFHREILEQCTDLRLLVEVMKDNQSSSGSNGDIQSMFCRRIRKLVATKHGDQGSTAMDDLSEWIDVVVDAMVAFPDDEGMQLEACGTLWSLASAYDDDKSAAGSPTCGAIEAIIGIIKRFDNNAGLLQCAYGALSSFSCREPDRLKLVKENCASAMIPALSKHGDGLDVQESLCQYLLGMCNTSYDLKVAIRSAGLISALLKIMRDHDSDISTQRWCLSALWNVTEVRDREKTEECVPNIDRILDTVIHIMKHHESDESLQHSSCAVLSNLLCNYGTYKSFTVSADSISEAISKAMRVHKDSTLVQQYASFALFSLCDGVENRMRQNVDDAQTQEQGCQALLAISSSVDIFRLVGDSALRTIISTLAAHRTVEFQNVGLDALKALCYSDEGKEAVISGEGVPGIISGMVVQSNNSGGQEKACHLLSILSTLDSGKIAICEADGVVALTTTMQQSFSNATLQRHALFTLRSLCTADETDIISCTEGALADVVEAMQGHPLVTELQEEACGALWGILAGSTADYATITMHGAIQAVLKAMKKHPDSEVLQEEAFGVLWNCSTDQRYAAAIGDANGMEVIIDAMAKHRTVEVHENACCVLSAMSSHDFLNKSRIMDTGGIDAIISSMLDFPASSNLQLAACSTLLNLAVDSDAMLAIGSHGGIPVLMNTLERHPDDGAIHETVCPLLFRLFSETQFSDLSSADVVKVIVNEMKAHRESLKVQESGLSTLANMCLKSSQVKKEIVSICGIEFVTRTMREHISSALLQQQACVALWCMAASPEYQRSILHAGGIFSILNSMLAHITVESVQEKACGALMALASYPEERAVIRAADGVTIITHSMRVNFHSPRVQEKACSVLANLAVCSNDGESVSLPQDEMDAIVTGMRLYPDSCGLQQSACLALWNYSILPCNAPTLRWSEYLPAVLRVAEVRFPSECGQQAHELLGTLRQSTDSRPVTEG